MSIEGLNITPRNKEHFKDSLKEFALKKEKLEATDFARENIRKFVNTEWRDVNEKFYAGNMSKLQEDLKELGFFSGESDGKFGIATLAALVNFQKSRNGITFDGIAGNDTKQEIIKALAEKKEKTVSIVPVSIELGGEEIKPRQKIIMDSGVVRIPQTLESFPGFPQKKGQEILEIISNSRYINYKDGILKNITDRVGIDDVIEPKIPRLYLQFGSDRRGLVSGRPYRLVWDVSASTYVFHKSNTEVYSDFPKQFVGKKALIDNGDQLIPSEDTDIAGRKTFEERQKAVPGGVDIKFYDGLEENLDKDDREYFYTYQKKTQELAKEEFPESAKPLLEKFSNISAETILEGIADFDPKVRKKIIENLSLIQKTAREGVMRSARSILVNDGHKLSVRDALTIHVTNRDRLLSFSITFNPLDGKLYVVPAGIGVNGFGDSTDSQETPLGTRRITQSRVGGDNQIMNPEGSTSTTMRFAASMATGLEKGLNANWRDAVTHGVAPERGTILKTAGRGLERDEMRRGSWGCTTMEGKDSQKIIGIYRKVEKSGYRVYQETMPPIYFGGPIFTSDISREQNIVFRARTEVADKGKTKTKKVARRKGLFEGLFS